MSTLRLFFIASVISASVALASPTPPAYYSSWSPDMGTTTPGPTDPNGPSG